MRESLLRRARQRRALNASVQGCVHSNYDQEICEHRHEKPAWFRPKESGIEKRLGPQQKKHAEGADDKKLVYEPQHKKETNGQDDEQWPPKTGKLSHFHRREKPQAPKQIDRQEREASDAGPGQALGKAAREFGFDQPRHADEQKEKASDNTSCLK